jgi:hypothetical protein
LQSQGVRKTARRDAEEVACGGVRVQPLARLPPDDALVIGGDGTDEHPRAASVERARRDTGVLQRLPGDLQEQALLGIERHGFTRRDAEERGVEADYSLRREQPRPARDAVAGWSAHQGPALLERLDRVTALFQQLPERGWPLCAAGKAAAEPHDRDRLGLGSFTRGQLGLELLDPDERRLEQLAHFLLDMVHVIRPRRAPVAFRSGELTARNGAPSSAHRPTARRARSPA